MARRERGDGPGVLHHVVNRGIAKRTCFETGRDVRSFVAGVARAVRRGEIALVAYCILTTHFHLVILSLLGLLSRSVGRIENEYVRDFNRSRRRDGPLFRGRFWSKPVHSEAYLRLLIPYVDHNSPKARLVETGDAYPWGSASHYVRGTSPRWLSRDLVENLVADCYLDGRYTGRRYAEVFGRPVSDAQAYLVERRLEREPVVADPLDDLLGAAPACVRDWMIRKAKLADGSRPGVPVVDPASVLSCLESDRLADEDWRVRHRRTRIPGWEPLAAGLLRLHSGCTLEEVGLRLGVSPSTARRRTQTHNALIGADEDYSTRAARVLHRAMRAAVLDE